MDRKTEAGGRHLPGSDENKVGNRKIGLTDFCESLEQEYPYAHAIGNIRAIIGADWIKPTEKVKRVQAVLDELNQRVLERCAGGTDMNVPTMSAGQPLTLEQLRAELEQKSKLRKMARAIEGEIAKCTLWRQAGNRL